VYMYDGEGNHKVMTMEEVSFFSLVSFEIHLFYISWILC
jgi:hypothetical protein